MATTKLPNWSKIWLIVLLLCGCQVVEDIPDTDIVFQTKHERTDIIPHDLGVINADGTELAYITFDSSPGDIPVAPIETSDGEFLTFYEMHLASAFTLGDLSAITGKGRLKNYDFHGYSRNPFIPNSHSIIIYYPTPGTFADGQHVIEVFDLDKGEIGETIYTTEKGQGSSLGTNAIYDSKLVFTLYSLSGTQLIVQDMENKQDFEILLETDTIEILDRHIVAGALFPAISPDGKWVAYTAKDGVYVIDTQTKEHKRIAEVCIACEDYPGNLTLTDWPPAPSWSPDSQWIVYHRCTLPVPQNCKDDIEDYTIFKAKIDTSEEIPLVEGGLNPYWRLSSAN